MKLVPTSISTQLSHEKRRIYFKLWQRKLHATDKRIMENTVSDYSLSGYQQTRSIFVHIPKSAGVSISNSLYNSKGGGHRTLFHYQRIFSYNKFNEFYKFTFVRNPWDRLFSAYNFLKNGGMNDADAAWSQRYLIDYASFDQFILEGISKKEIQEYIHFKTQIYYLINSDRRICVDFVGLYENLHSDFQHICHTLEISAPSVNHLNSADPSRNNGYINSYTSEMKSIVKDIYAEEIDIFGYKFDNSTLRNQVKTRSEIIGKLCSITPGY